MAPRNMSPWCRSYKNHRERLLCTPRAPRSIGSKRPTQRLGSMSAVETASGVQQTDATPSIVTMPCADRAHNFVKHTLI